MQEENTENSNIPFLYQDNAITLPLDRDSFRDFMVSLLGKPEVLEGYRDGAFEIDFEKVKYFHDLLEQRIFDQNDSSFIEFRAKLYFSDQTSHEFTGIDSFLNYKREYQKVSACIGFNFTWIYLVKFNNRSHPEKQEISIFNDLSNDSRTNKKDSGATSTLLEVFFEETPRIKYSIRHTNLRWSLEIEEVIKSFLNSIFEIQGSMFALRKKLIETMDIVFLFSMFLSMLIPLKLISDTSKLRKIITVFQDNSDVILSNQTDIADKLNWLINYSVAEGIESFSPNPLLFVLTIFLSIVIVWFGLICFYSLIDLPTHQFILFTEYSKKMKKRYLADCKKGIFLYICGLIGSIVCSVGANYIYDFLSKL